VPQTTGIQLPAPPQETTDAVISSPATVSTKPKVKKKKKVKFLKKLLALGSINT